MGVGVGDGCVCVPHIGVPHPAHAHAHALHFTLSCIATWSIILADTLGL